MALFALCFGFISAVMTNSFIRRPEPDYNYCLRSQDQNPELDCSQKATESTGWPFPSKLILNNGVEKNIKTDTSGYCIGGCGMTSIGDQFTYNGLLMSLVYFCIFAVVVKVRRQD